MYICTEAYLYIDTCIHTYIILYTHVYMLNIYMHVQRYIYEYVQFIRKHTFKANTYNNAHIHIHIYTGTIHA